MLIEKLNWRYATKKMDPSQDVPQDKLDTILQAISLAPTSSGLQPFEVLVVTNPDVRAKLQKVAWNQTQITDGSHLLVLAAWDNYTDERIDAVTAQMAAERGGMTDLLAGYYDNLKAMYLPRDADTNFEHAARQAYLALGFGLVAAAFEGVDATPMEGFDADAVNEILGLRERGLRVTTIVPLGYRDTAGDWLVNLKKVRRPMDKLVTSVD